MRDTNWPFASFLSPFFILSACVLLTACQTSPEKQVVVVSPYTHVDSTTYFSERTASVSMRATFNRGQSATMSEGYKFQFRTISNRPVFLSSISIVAGGKRFFLEQGQIVLPSQKGVTLQLPLKDSVFVAQFPSALLQFKQNNTSEIFSIELHQIKEFAPQ